MSNEDILDKDQPLEEVLELSRVKKDKCLFFEWKDPPFSHRSRAVILHLMDYSTIDKKEGMELVFIKEKLQLSLKS